MTSRPLMVVVAGPAGSGKSTAFPVTSLGVTGFNIDDRCAALHGSYQGIPSSLRAEVARQCESFIEACLADSRSFAVETTLRTRAAIEQARRANAQGFSTVMVFLATEDAAINVQRIAVRGLAGGHSAPRKEIEAIHRASLANLAPAIDIFGVVRCYDNSTLDGPRLVASFRHGMLSGDAMGWPGWLQRALRRS